MNSLIRSAARIPSPRLTTARLPRARTYATETPHKKPMGAFRGGLLGLLLGATIAGGTGYYYLVDEYQTASSLLLSSVEELQTSTNRVRDYARKIETVDREVRKIREDAATKEEVAQLRVEMKKLYDSLSIEHLELKTHVWGVEQDVHRITRNNK